MFNLDWQLGIVQQENLASLERMRKSKADRLFVRKKQQDLNLPL